MFDLFKFSKLLNIEDGKLELMNTPINIVPTSILCNIQKSLVEQLGLEKAYSIIYQQAKEGSISYNREFIKKQKFSDKRKILDWQIKVVSFAGWGELEIALALLDSKEKRNIVHFKNPTFPIIYGKSNYPVDFIPAGFIAGGLSENLGIDLDVVETKCVSMKDQFCEFEVGKPEAILDLRNKLWKKWGLI